MALTRHQEELLRSLAKGAYVKTAEHRQVAYTVDGNILYHVADLTVFSLRKRGMIEWQNGTDRQVITQHGRDALEEPTC